MTLRSLLISWKPEQGLLKAGFRGLTVATMTRRIERRAKLLAGAAVLGVIVLSLAGEARAQSSGGGGPLNFLDNLFNGSKGNQTVQQQPAGPAQAAPGPGAALPWSGE